MSSGLGTDHRPDVQRSETKKIRSREAVAQSGRWSAALASHGWCSTRAQMPQKKQFCSRYTSPRQRRFYGVIGSAPRHATRGRRRTHARSYANVGSTVAERAVFPGQPLCNKTWCQLHVGEFCGKPDCEQQSLWLCTVRCCSRMPSYVPCWSAVAERAVRPSVEMVSFGMLVDKDAEYCRWATFWSVVAKCASIASWYERDNTRHSNAAQLDLVFSTKSTKCSQVATPLAFYAKFPPQTVWFTKFWKFEKINIYYTHRWKWASGKVPLSFPSVLFL